MWVHIRGERWSLRDDSGLDADTLGECDHANRIIRAPIHGPTLNELDTICHEIIHGCYPDLSEDAVIEGAGTLSTILMEKLNWRKQDD